MYCTPTIALLVIALLSTAATSGRAADSDASTGITVTGTGEVKAQPDIAYLTFGISTQADDAAKAAKENSANTNAVIVAISKAGIPKSDIETTNYSVSPITDYKKSPPVVVGYTVFNQIRVTVRSLNAIGSLIDAGVNAGANNVQGVNFSVEDDTALHQQALVNAIKQARAKAQAMAEAAGVKLGKLVAMSETGGYSPRPMLMGVAKAEGAPTPIIPGELTETASVTVVYAIL
ncbi:MAG: SIMPL domain-containing protein [Armatimonadota bacterium]